MRELSLFTGIGGGLLGTKLLGWEPVGYVEWDDYCQRVIKQRIKDGIFPNAPIFSDIRAFNRDGYAAAYQGLVDVISAGFPCQPFSVAGKQAGSDDPRNMWPATIEAIRLVRPRIAWLENVPGLLSSGYFGTILGDLAESGYDTRWRILSAAEVGAPHKRDRVFILAHAAGDLWGASGHDGREAPDGAGYREEYTDAESPKSGADKSRIRGGAERFCEGYAAGPVADATNSRASGWQRIAGDDADAGRERGAGRNGSRPDAWGETVADSHGPRLAQREGQPGDDGEEQPSVIGSGWWTTEPELGRLANGVPNRVDRLRGAGNGQVPGVVATAWRLLTEDFTP